jgi:hypothetical protein
VQSGGGIQEEFVNRKSFVGTRSLVAKGVFALAAASLLSSTPAQAQQTEIEALREQLEALQARLDTLEAAKITTDEASRATPNVTASQAVRVSGLLQVRATNLRRLRYQPQAFELLDPSDTFRLRRAEIRFTAPTITSRISATAMFDLARGLSSNAVAAPTSTNLSQSVLQEIQLSYLLKKAQAWLYRQPLC